MEREMARLEGGASSPTRGSMICGVTVVIAVMKEMARKTLKSFVTQSPILEVSIWAVVFAVKNIPQGGSEEDQHQSEWSAGEEISQWTDKQ